MPELKDISALQKKIMEEAKQYLSVPPGEDEITATQFMKESGCSRRQANDTLNEMVEKEILTVRKNGIMDNKKCNVYKYKDE